MRWFLVVAGVSAHAFAWWLVSFRGRELWHVVPSALAAMGVAALVAMPNVEPRVGESAAVIAGVASGAVLYICTRVVVALAVRWRTFARHVREAYGRSAEEPFTRSLLLSLFVSVPGEERFYRGLVARTLAARWLGG